jgi:hypothetical protein
MFSIIFASLKCHAECQVQIHPSGVENKKSDTTVIRHPINNRTICQ